MWVHGNTAVPERMAGDVGADGPLLQVDRVPKSDYIGLHQGPGIRFRGKAGHENWFHFAIPTPVLMHDAQALLERVFVLYNTEPGIVSVLQVDVFDGPNLLRSFPTGGTTMEPNGTSGIHDGRGAAGTGDGRRFIVDGDTRFTLGDKPLVIWGVGISVRVFFAQEGEIRFTAAGADFVVP
jgi:hypothetical protein